MLAPYANESLLLILAPSKKGVVARAPRLPLKSRLIFTTGAQSCLATFVLAQRTFVAPPFDCMVETEVLRHCVFVAVQLP